MSIKDLDTGENKDRNSTAAEDEKDSRKLTDSEKKLPAAEDIKNANATGDGSYGRNDESLPEEDADDKKAESAY